MSNLCARFLLRKPLQQTLLGILLLLAVPLSDDPSWSGLVFAQEGEEQEETRQVSGISEKVYRKFAEFQEFLEAENYTSALKVLDEVKNRKKLSGGESVQLYRLYGHVYFNQERYQDAIKAFETLLLQEEISEREKNDTQFTLAQLHFQIEDWQGAIKILENWLASVSNPPSDPYIMLASAYYQIDRLDKVIAPVERAIAIARERDKPVKEHWWLLLRAGYFEVNNTSKVIEILETLVVGWPKKDYWTMLSGMYGEANREKRQLGAYEAAHDQNLLVSSAEIVTLAQLMMQAEASYKGALVLEKGFADGIVDETESNFRLLSQAWQLAAEYEKAIEPLQRAARISGDGELDVRLANSYLNLRRYDECVTSGRSGLNKGGLKRAEVAQELLGMCLFEQEKFEESKTAFRQAARLGDEKMQRRSATWVKFIEGEQARIAQINASIKQARLARDAVKNR